MGMGIHDGHREKMRQRFLKGGLDPFADHEVLELLLCYAIPRIDVNPLAHTLIERYGSLTAALTAPAEDLEKVRGIGESAAVLLNLIPAVSRRARLADAERERVLSDTARAGAYLLERFAGERNEVLYQLCLDRKGKLLTCKRLGTGGVSSVDLNIRQLMENAIISGASSVILAHNHPSGLALPSQEDYAVTDRARAALATIDVALRDHIIVADNDFVSLAESGFFA